MKARNEKDIIFLSDLYIGTSIKHFITKDKRERSTVSELVVLEKTTHTFFLINQPIFTKYNDLFFDKSYYINETGKVLVPKEEKNSCESHKIIHLKSFGNIVQDMIDIYLTIPNPTEKDLHNLIVYRKLKIEIDGIENSSFRKMSFPIETLDDYINFAFAVYNPDYIKKTISPYNPIKKRKIKRNIIPFHEPKQIRK